VPSRSFGYPTAPYLHGVFSLGSILGIQWTDIAKVALGAVITLLLAWVQARRSRLRWRAFHQHLAGSLTHPAVGNITVTLNGKVMTNLVLSTVVLENDYLRDFKDFRVRVNIANGHEIAGDEARRGQDVSITPWSQRFSDAVDAAVQEATGNPEAPDPFASINGWREYAVPVLNRGEKLTVTLVVHAVPPTPPACGLEVEAPGALLQFQGKAMPQLGGVHPVHALLWGVVLAVPLGDIILHVVPEPWRPAVFFVLGTTVVGVGVVPVLAYRWIRNRLV
jgi:hypothetical protein